MTSAENSVSEPANLKSFWRRIPPVTGHYLSPGGWEDLGLNEVKFSRSPLIAFDDFRDPPPPPPLLPSHDFIFQANLRSPLWILPKFSAIPPFVLTKIKWHFFFSLLRFLSVLIFKHKNQTNKSSVIKRLILSDWPNFIVSSIMFDYRIVRLDTPGIIELLRG